MKMTTSYVQPSSKIFFKDKIIKIRKNIDEERKKLIKENKCQTCTSCITVFKTIETDDLKIFFKSINCKFSILDPITTWLLLEYFNKLASILISIINKSLSTGIFSSTLKQSVVKPIIKNFCGDPTELLNYRPISNISFLSKLLEISVLVQLNNLLVDNKLYCNSQSAFCHIS